MLAQLHNRRFYFILTADLALFVVAFVGAFLLRFDFTLAPADRGLIVRLLPFLLPGKILLFFLFGMYRGMWRYTSLNDLARLLQATFLAMLFYISVTLYIYGFQGVPRSVFLIDAMLTFLFCGALRLAIRLSYATVHSERLLPSFFSGVNSPGISEKSVLIIGAGGAGEKMLREIFDNPHLDYQVVGFLDDDHNKWGRSLHGVRVFGGVEMLPKIINRKNIDEVLIATPAATGTQMRRIIEICKNNEVNHRTLPEIGAIIDGKLSIKNLRDVKYEDLLRRPPVCLDKTGVSRYLQGKRVFVTGAGGSIGSELCRQIIRFDPEELILLDASEVGLYGIQMELHHELNFPRYRCILSRVQDKALMDDVFREYRPHIIFHAAAYKHVPMLEQNPWEAVYNNVLGSQVVMDLAVQYGVERFVLVSTDKAVRPTSIMGASKRLAELIAQARQGNATRFMAVRFGNVIGSSGSVLPLFLRQLELGGPITVTHPDVTRYFMTIPEAAQLILQAGGLGEGGDIFILEMGTPIKIAKMAEELVRLSGKTVGKDVDIIFTGLRAGEKLYEELITLDEGVVNTNYEKIMMLRSNGGNGYNKRAKFAQWLDGTLEDLYQIASTHNSNAIKIKFNEILPEYQPDRNSPSVLQINKPQKKYKDEVHGTRVKSNVITSKRIMNIPFHKPHLTELEIDLVSEAIRSGWITMGPKTIQFEKKFKEYIFSNSNIPEKEQFSVSFNSATAALHLALKAIGLNQGDEVIIPANTFVATAEVITYFKAIPIICDIAYDTHNMDVTKLTSLLTRKTKAIIPVHFGGQPCDMDEIVAIGRKHGIAIIEDAAHCLPSSYKGRKIGTIGDITCFSFYATKTLAAGEGGMAVTRNPDYTNCMKVNRLHGISCDAWDRYTDKGAWHYEVVDSGFKYNTTDIHSAIAIGQLDKLEWMGNKRARIAHLYNNAFKCSNVITPVIKPDRTTSWHLYVIKVKNRNELIDKLNKSGIGTSVHFIPIYRHPYYNKTYNYFQNHFPQAERVFNESLSIPIFPSMTDAEANYIAEKVLEYAR